MKSLGICALAIAVLVANNAAAQSIPAPTPIKRTARVMPPPEYDKPFPGNIILRIVSENEVREMCSTVTFKGPAIGCAKRYGDLCRIWIVSDKEIRASGFTPEIVLRHERGHCNSWPKGHPNAISIEEWERNQKKAN